MIRGFFYKFNRSFETLKKWQTLTPDLKTRALGSQQALSASNSLFLTVAKKVCRAMSLLPGACTLLLILKGHLNSFRLLRLELRSHTIVAQF